MLFYERKNKKLVGNDDSVDLEAFFRPILCKLLLGFEFPRVENRECSGPKTGEPLFECMLCFVFSSEKLQVTNQMELSNWFQISIYLISMEKKGVKYDPGLIFGLVFYGNECLIIHIVHSAPVEHRE